MAKYRQLQTCFWKDSFVTELTPEEKFFYMYLMTNDNTTQCGIYTFIVKFAEVETGYNRETIEKLLNRFIEYGKIKYCSETKEIMVVNWLKHNFIGSKPVISCINKELKQVKQAAFVKDLYNVCKNNNYPVETIFYGIDRVSIGYTSHSEEEKIPCREEEEIEKEEKEEVEEKINAAAAAFNADLNNSFKKVINAFNNNIHPITPMEYEKLCDWCKDMDFEVVIAAIEEAVKHNARTMAYIERVLNSWLEKGYSTIQGVNAHQRDFKNKRELNKENRSIPNAKAYELLE
jgi:DnaD/phage-associated family protein